MRTRPIFHSSDAAIRGHVFCSFLALLMRAELNEIFGAGGVPEWSALLRELDRLQQVRLRHREVDWLVRTDATPAVSDLFRRVRIALPPRARQAKPPDPEPAPKPALKRRGRPRRSAAPSRISPKTTPGQ
jgi:hypothetical protein